MPDFSIILQSPEIRQIVQTNTLERMFHDSLMPRLLFRGEAMPQPYPAGVGDTMFFSAPGLIDVDGRPLAPQTDPSPVNFTYEQWFAQLQQYAGTIDTHMPTSMVAIAELFLRNAQQLGLQAARTLNSIVRDRMYNAALSGWTVANGAQSGTSLIVQRLNGFTRARNPNLAAGSPVRFDQVSANNPLSIHVFDNGADRVCNVTGYSSVTPGDEIGPGTLTLDASMVSVANRGYVFSADASDVIRVGGGNSVDSLGASDVVTLADCRSAVAQFWQNNVPEHPDGRFHCHLDPISQTRLFADNEFQRLLTALPDYYMYKQFALGELLGTVFFRNSECPVASTVVGGSTATFSQKDPFAGELFSLGVLPTSNASSLPVHRLLFTAQGGIFEYYSDLSNLITEAGVTGKVGEPRIVNNGIEVMSERIQLIIRGPLNRLQDMVSTSWKFIGDWPARTDAATGDAARYKRFTAIEHT
jgi:hypothetical protein